MAEEGDLPFHLFTRRVSRQDRCWIANFELGGDRVCERSFDYDLAYIGNGYELSSRGGEFALILKLIRDDAGDWRTNSGIAKLRVECRNTLLCLGDFRCRERPVIWIERLCAQRYGLLGETQLVFSG